MAWITNGNLKEWWNVPPGKKRCYGPPYCRIWNFAFVGDFKACVRVCSILLRYINRLKNTPVKHNIETLCTKNYTEIDLRSVRDRLRTCSHWRLLIRQIIPNLEGLRGLSSLFTLWLRVRWVAWHRAAFFFGCFLTFHRNLFFFKELVYA